MPTENTVPQGETSLDVGYLHSLLRLAKKLERAHDYPAVIDALSEEIEAVIGYHTSWVYLFDEDGETARLLTAHEDVGITEQVPTLDISNDPFLREIRAADHIVIVEDARTDPRTNKEIVAALGNRSIINVPVFLAGRKLGTIGTGTYGEEGVLLPDEAQMDYLSSMASHAAVALDRIRLYRNQLAAEEEKRQMQAHVAHVQRLEGLGMLAGGIAHDFNNLLTTILGNASLAENKLPADSPLRKHLAHISTAGRRATDLCLQMLAYAGHRGIQPRAIDLSQLIHEMGTLLEVSIGKGTCIDYFIAEALPSMLGDIAQVQQIMMNLITNANEAIGGEGRITIRTGRMRIDRTYLKQLSFPGDAKEGEYVFFEVADTGCGMDEATKERLFDPFFTTKFTGRGLGMSAVMGIIKSHHGALNLYSEPGHGTTFKVLFPAVDLPAEPLGIATEDDSPVPGGTVLVVDDEAMVRETTVLILQDMGLHVLAAGNGRNALDRLRQHADEVDLVLLDMTMPDMDGVETLCALRGIKPGVPIIVASGYSPQDNARRFAEQQPDGFLQKPYQPENLRRELHKVLHSGP